MNRLIQLRQTAAAFLLAFGLACFGLSPAMQAVIPAPDGGYPGGNTAEGQAALLSLTTGGFNTAVGYLSLRSNTTSSFNTAIGAGALFASSTTATENTATGTGALLSDTTGFNNTATGAFDLLHNTTGAANSGFGGGALASNTTGFSNTGIGVSALSNNTTGSGNTAVGSDAGFNVVTASNVICIGVAGGNVNNSTWIGNVYQTTTVSGTTLPVIVSDHGQLGTTPSSRRFKKEIKPMDQASEAILGLKPVTFHYKSDKTNTPQFGLVAEEVAEVNPDLVVRDKEGKPYSVRYDQVNTMLLNEFLKEHKTVQEQRAMIAKQQKQIDALTAGLQKVNDELEMSKAATRTVLNDQ